MKEISCKQCYVNGARAAVASYDDNTHRVLYFWGSLGDGQGIADLRAAGVSLHSYTNSWVIPSADLAGVQSVVPGAVIDWEGSKEYEARRAAAAGSRPGGGNKTGKKSATGGGSSSGAASGAATVPAVAAPDAFRVPELSACPVLSDLVGKMPPVVESLNSWAADYSAAMLAGSDAVAAPACIDQLGAFVPGIADAFKAYETIINNAVNDHREKLAAAEAARVAAEQAAAAAAAAAANGKNLVVLPDGSTVEVTGKPHKELARVCQLIKLGLHVYLVGPAGTGKTYLCKQVAEALGRPFFSDQKVSQDFQLLGFVDASGKYQETELYRAVTSAGVHMLDEFDASDECAGVVFNSLLANGYMTFPGVGRVEAAPGFACIACGNTIGRGADSEYTGRNCLDAATLDRFVMVRVDYDPEIELRLAGGDQNLVDFVHAVRAAIKCTGVQLLASMRAIETAVKLDGLFPETEILEMGLLKGLEKDQIALLANECKGNNKWFKALKALAA